MDGIRLIKCIVTDDDDEIVFRGIIDPSYLHLLQVDRAYQREELSGDTVNKIATAIRAGEHVPDIILGMRGEKYEDRDGATFLLDPVYIIDGQQRRAGALKSMEQLPAYRPLIGCKVYFNTTTDSETIDFRKLNTTQTRLKPSVLIASYKRENPAVRTLYELTLDRSFALHSRVTWTQRAANSELFSARTYLKTIGALHNHIATGGRANSAIQMVSSLSNQANRVGLSNFRDNTRAFFELVDMVWGVRDANRNTSMCPHLRFGFLHALATVFSRNLDFWTPKGILFVDAKDRQKLQKFDLMAPDILHLTTAPDTARQRLMTHIEDHLNSGRRTGRLSLRPSYQRAAPLPEDEVEVGIAAK